MAKKPRDPQRPKTSKRIGFGGPDEKIGVEVSKGFAARLDLWRKNQTSHPGRAEALRRLAERALVEDGY